MPLLKFVTFLVASSLALPAAPANNTAVVAVFTNREGAHLGNYYAAFAASPETAQVYLVTPDSAMIPAARKALGSKFAGSYPSPAALLAVVQPQITLVSLEPKLAPAAIRAALAAGSHVIAEKPAVLNTEQFTVLAGLAREKKRELMLALANRSDPLVVFARDYVGRGEIGRVFGVEMHIIADQTRLKNPNYGKSWYAQKARAGGGHLIWLGIHWLDLAMNLTRSPVSEVGAFYTNIGGQKLDVEDSATLTLKFDQGFLGTMTSGYYLHRGYHAHLKIWGSDGWIEINQHGADVPLRYYSTKMEKPAVKSYAPPAGTPTGYTAFVAAAVRGALGLEPPPITTDESLRAIATVFGAYQAADEAKTIKLGNAALFPR